MTCIFEDTLLQSSQQLFQGIDRVLLAVSGGADSVAMAHALHRLSEEGRFFCRFVIGHVNHCLRGPESDADEVFVEQIGQSLDISVISQRVDVKSYALEHKLSLETAGRVLRLKALAQMAEQSNCNAIATAHHADDLAETMIHRLMRGTGFRGLCGIKSMSIVDGAIYFRPMLAVRRAEILQYCNDHRILWRQDESNRNLKFTRNRIRHRLLPQLQGGSDLTDLLIKLSLSTQHLQQRVDEVLKNSLNELTIEGKGFSRVSYNQEKLNACSPWTFYEIVRQGIVTIGGGLKGYSRSHFDTIRNMAVKSKAKADFPGKLEVIVGNGAVTIQRREYKPSERKRNEGVILWPDHTVKFGPWKISSRLFCADKVDIEQFLKTRDNFVEWFDADKVSVSLEICRRQEGDRFWPIGAKGPKKVARFLIDAQLDEQVKKQAFIIKDTQKILWVAPVRMSEQFKITPQTHHILEIRISKLK